MGVQKSPLQKTYEMSVGTDSINVELFGANRQFDWVEISLVFFYKSDKHLTTYDSYNVELASKNIKSVALKNFTEAYSLTNEKKYDVDNLTQRRMLYKQFVTWSYNGCSIASLTDYINNQIYQELSDKNNYFTTSVEGIYLDLRASYGYTKEMKETIQN